MTRSKTTFLSAALAGLMLSGCATAPDPAKVCTSDWIGARSSKALDRIESRSKSSMNALKKAGESFAQGKQPGVFQLLALSNSMNKLKKELTDGAGVRDLKTLASTCNDPDIIKKSMSDLLDRQSFSPQLRNMVESNPLFKSVVQEMINSIATGAAPKT